MQKINLSLVLCPSCRYQYQQKKEVLLSRTPDNVFSPQRIRCHHPKCPRIMNNHCGAATVAGGSGGGGGNVSGGNLRGSANKLTNLREPTKLSNNRINSIHIASLANNGNSNYDNISPDNSEIQSINNAMNGTVDDRHAATAVLRNSGNSLPASSAAQAFTIDNEYGNVSGRDEGDFFCRFSSQ